MDNNYISTEEEKKISLDILKKFDSICNAHSIKYFLGYGTLIGAVRHQGFIPWDDDIDVIMFRDEYTKFIKVSKELGEGYECIYFENDSFYLPYMKVVNIHTKVVSQGVNNDINIGIDVFPVDFISNTINDGNIKKQKIAIYEKLMRYSLYNSLKEINSERFDLPRSVFYYIAKILGWKKSAHLYRRKRESLLPHEKTKYVGMYSSFNNSIKPLLELSDLDGEIMMKFEDYEFPCPAGYDHMLRSIYVII